MNDRRSYQPGAMLSSGTTADGWTLRRFDLSRSPRPRGSILWLGGRGDIFEKYLECFERWNGSGWNITSFDWRGQGGSGRLTSNPHVGHIDDFSTWVDDLAQFVSGWQKERSGPYVIMGHSMGGHLLLRALVEKRVDPDAAVLVSPMLGFASAPLPFTAALALATVMALVVSPSRPAWKHNERPSAGKIPRQSLLTHDDSRYADEIWWNAEHPELALGPPSWGWMAAAYKSIATVRGADLGAVQTPLLILGTEGDRLVSATAIRAAATRLPNATLRMFDNTAAHEILRETDHVRDFALNAVDEFLNDL